jgi:hypothetical protein
MVSYNAKDRPYDELADAIRSARGAGVTVTEFLENVANLWPAACRDEAESSYRTLSHAIAGIRKLTV